MDATSYVLLLTQLATLMAAVIGVVAAVLARREGRASKTEAREARAEISELHILVNSRLTEFVALNRKSAHAEGVKQERDNPS